MFVNAAGPVEASAAAILALMVAVSAVRAHGARGGAQSPVQPDGVPETSKRIALSENRSDPNLNALKALLVQIEASGSASQRRSVGWMLGSFPRDHWLQKHTGNLPRIRAQMTASQTPSDTYAYNTVSMFSGRSDITSQVAELVRKVAWS